MMLRGSLLLLGLPSVAAGAFFAFRRGWRLSSTKMVAMPCEPYVASSLKRALLISNSKISGLGYLDHVEEHITRFLGELDTASFVLFVPYALADRDAYTSVVRTRLGAMGYTVRSLHEFRTAEARRAAVRDAACLFVGGGNTYRLKKSLEADRALLPLVRKQVATGALKFIGSSAGTNLACPTVRNTNDMPIVWPASLAGLCLVPFQINTHYIDPEREVKHHMGETREKRIAEFHEENSIPVVALREGASILVEGDSATLLGPARTSESVTWRGARLMRRVSDGGAAELAEGASLDELMSSAKSPEEQLDDGATGRRRQREDAFDSG